MREEARRNGFRSVLYRFVVSRFEAAAILIVVAWFVMVAGRYEPNSSWPGAILLLSFVWFAIDWLVASSLPKKQNSALSHAAGLINNSLQRGLQWLWPPFFLVVKVALAFVLMWVLTTLVRWFWTHPLFR